MGEQPPNNKVQLLSWGGDGTGFIQCKRMVGTIALGLGLIGQWLLSAEAEWRVGPLSPNCSWNRCIYRRQPNQLYITYRQTTPWNPTRAGIFLGPLYAN